MTNLNNCTYSGCGVVSRSKTEARWRITSAFIISSSGEFSEYQLGLLFFPH
jgi:hypothetical protein